MRNGDETEFTFFVMDLLTVLAYPIVFVYGKLIGKYYHIDNYE